MISISLFLHIIQHMYYDKETIEPSQWLHDNINLELCIRKTECKGSLVSIYFYFIYFKFFKFFDLCFRAHNASETN